MKSLLQNINPRMLEDVSSLQETVVVLLNLVEQQSEEIEKYKAEIQILKDEINRLKGEQGKPKFKPKPKKDLTSTPPSGSKKMQSGKNHKRGPKKPNIPIDKVEVCEVETSQLPADAVFKYYDEIIQQDLSLVRNNVLYKVKVYYSPSEGKTYRGVLPDAYQGAFGLGIQSLSKLLHHYCDMTQSRLEALYSSLGVLISSGTINNMLLSDTDWVLAEQRAILSSGIEHSPYSQIDSTKSVERGVRKATQIICAEYFSVFYTMDDKTRLSVLKALLGHPADSEAPEEGLQVAYNNTSQGLLEEFGVSKSDRLTLSQLFTEGQVLTLDSFEQNIREAAPSIYNKKNMYPRIRESMVLGYYHHQSDFPIVHWLLSDDAPEYKKIAAHQQALCWIHDARFYKKLVPKIEVHRTILQKTMEQYWTFYGELLDFKAQSNNWSKEQQSTQKQVLLKRFDAIFTQKTDYFQVNTCLERTLRNKDKLLAVLDNPALPLHNNAAELGARRIVRKRDISLHTWSKEGTRVRDAFMSIVETAAKLGISALEYIEDRISKRYQMTPLEILIQIAYQ